MSYIVPDSATHLALLFFQVFLKLCSFLKTIETQIFTWWFGIYSLCWQILRRLAGDELFSASPAAPPTTLKGGNRLGLLVKKYMGQITQFNDISRLDRWSRMFLSLSVHCTGRASHLKLVGSKDREKMHQNMQMIQVVLETLT